MREPIGREAVDDAERVAKIIVEPRPDNPGRKRMADVANILSDLIPNVRNIARLCLPLQIDEDGCNTRARVASQRVETLVSCSFRSIRSVT